MLQRIQSVYLALVFVFTMLVVSLPIGNFEVEGVKTALKITGLDQPPSDFPELDPGFRSVTLIFLSFGIMVLTIFTIFQFKHRRKQIQLGKVNVLLHMVQIFSAFYFIDFYRENLLNLPFTHSFVIYLPLISMILIILANKAIKKDDLLVRSTDRIR